MAGGISLAPSTVIAYLKRNCNIPWHLLRGSVSNGFLLLIYRFIIIGMKYMNMIIVAILVLRFTIKLRFPANIPIAGSFIKYCQRYLSTNNEKI